MTKAAISAVYKRMLQFGALTRRRARCLLLSFLCVPLWATVQNTAGHSESRTVKKDMVGQVHVNLRTITLLLCCLVLVGPLGASESRQAKTLILPMIEGRGISFHKLPTSA